MIEQALEALKTFDWGGDVNALQPINDALVASHDQADARLELEKKLLAALNGEIKRAGKDFVCRALTAIGSAESVPTLSKLLADPHDSHLARLALERIPGSDPRNALISAVKTLTGAQRIGVIGSLGTRAEPESVAVFASLLNDDDSTLACAAAGGLGNIRNSEAAKVLANSKSENEELKMAVVDARLMCAEGMLAAGQSGGALLIYKSLANDSQPKHVKLGATRGVLACAGKK